MNTQFSGSLGRADLGAVPPLQQDDGVEFLDRSIRLSPHMQSYLRTYMRDTWPIRLRALPKNAGRIVVRGAQWLRWQGVEEAVQVWQFGYNMPRGTSYKD